MHPKQIAIADYTYNLPEEKIAYNPLAERDQSKLLIWQDEKIKEDIYKNITNYLPENSLLIFNDTKVIQARILFFKSSGSKIELFCLELFCHSYCLTMMFRCGNSTCNFTFAFNAVNTRIKVSMVALLALLSSLEM